MHRQTGDFLGVSTAGIQCQAFIPRPLPPVPALQIDAELRHLIDHALLALGKLDGVSTFLPDTSLFLYAYIRKEAVMSSQIEGTQSSLSDLLLFENAATPGVPLGDVQEVSNYVAAVEHGVQRLRDGFPISLRLLREIHEILLSKGRGSHIQAGEFRRSQNWVGGSHPGNALYIPPPPDKLMTCMSDLEKFIHGQPEQTPVLIKAALAHVQFESIHPFLDGNGRLGRLLITLLLCAEGILKDPILYLSLYFKIHRQTYYDRLQAVRTNGDWEGWLYFFMQGVKETALMVVESTHTLIHLFAEDRARLQALGKAAGSVLRVHHALQRRPLLTIAKACELTGLSVPTVTEMFSHLVKLGIVEETTGRKRNRLYVYREYIRILNEGTG